MSNALVEKKQIVDKVQARVEKMTETGELHLPQNYSPQNALNSAWLKLQETRTKDKKPVLNYCNRSSIMNALFKMITMGLNPEKSQCYFIAYGKTLACQPSYFGKEKIAKSECGVRDIYKRAIFEGDEIEIEIEKGNEKVVRHKSSFSNKQKKIVGAYAVAVFDDDRPDKTVIMTMEQIKSAWSQGQIYKEGRKGTTHEKFEEAMAKKTASNRLCTSIINSSDDSNLAISSFKQSQSISDEEEAQKEIEENANSEVIDIPSEEELTEEEIEDNFEEAKEEIDDTPLPSDNLFDDEEDTKAPF